MGKLRRTGYSMGAVLALERMGGPAALAKALGIGASAITQWGKIPAHHVPAISEITGIPRHELRPDLWVRETTP